VPLTRDNLVKEWNKGYGLVTWFGHGSADGAFRTVWTKDDGDLVPSYQEVDSPAFLTYDDVIALDDTRPSFVFHGSCSNGEPERPDNIAYGLLRHGAVGTIASTRVAIMSIYTGSVAMTWSNLFGMERDFTGYMLQGMSVGEAAFAAKDELIEAVGLITWFTRHELSLYGDPSLTLASCAKDADCDDGKLCSGKETCKAGQCIAGTVVVCTSADPCTERTCAEPGATCVDTARPEGEACDDGLFCTVNETCQSGKCNGEPRCAARENPCVRASCDEQARSCDVYSTSQQGQVCHAGTARQGTCQAGICEPDPDSGGCAAAAAGGSPARTLLAALPPGLLLLLLGLALATRRRGGA